MEAQWPTPRTAYLCSDIVKLAMKPIEWIGDSLERVSAFSRDAKRLMGYQLWRAQSGMEPADAKPMPSVGLGVQEIRVRAGGAYRVFYVAKFAEAVYVLHAFEKKTCKTRGSDIELGKRRFATLVKERKQRV